MGNLDVPPGERGEKGGLVKEKLLILPIAICGIVGYLLLVGMAAALAAAGPYFLAGLPFLPTFAALCCCYALLQFSGIMLGEICFMHILAGNVASLFLLLVPEPISQFLGPAFLIIIAIGTTVATAGILKLRCKEWRGAPSKGQKPNSVATAHME